MNLQLSKARGQCYYDGASNMAGSKSGLAKQLCDEEPKSLFTHCLGIGQNLVYSDTVKV